MHKKMFWFGATLFLSVAVWGCVKEMPQGTVGSLSDINESPSGTAAAGEETQTTYGSEGSDGQPASADYPSTEEILAALDAGESKQYWLAEMPDCPDTVDIFQVAVPDMGEICDSLLEKVFPGALVSQDQTAEMDGEETRSIEFTWDGRGFSALVSPSSLTIKVEQGTNQLDALVTPIMDTLGEWTGLGYGETEPDEDSDSIACYAFYKNNIALDQVGHSLESDPDVWIAGTWAEVSPKGSFSVPHLSMVSSLEKTLETDGLVSVDQAREICDAHFQSTAGYPSVKVFTGADLVYYESGGQLVPAWRFTGKQYVSEDGHNISMLVDAQTGRILRET